MLWIKNKATQLLMVNDLHPLKHYLHSDIMIFRRRSWRTYLHHRSLHQWKKKHMKTWEITWIIIWHLSYLFIISSWINIDNIELHLYLRLDRRQKSKRDARVDTCQHEQYVVTVHLFIGTGRSPDKITFVSLITNHNYSTNYPGQRGLFLFKSVHPFWKSPRGGG